MSELVGPGSKYTDEDRRRAAVEYLIAGNMAKVSRSTGIAESTLCEWKKSEWWVHVSEEVRSEKGDEVDARLTQVIDSAFEQAQDRVEQGDFRVNKHGELIRVPMSGRDLVIAGATAMDKQRLLRNQPTSISSKTQEDNLARLARVFQYVSRNSVWNPETQEYGLPSIEGECEEIE